MYLVGIVQKLVKNVCSLIRTDCSRLFYVCFDSWSDGSIIVLPSTTCVTPSSWRIGTKLNFFCFISFLKVLGIRPVAPFGRNWTHASPRQLPTARAVSNTAERECSDAQVCRTIGPRQTRSGASWHIFYLRFDPVTAARPLRFESETTLLCRLHSER